MIPLPRALLLAVALLPLPGAAAEAATITVTTTEETSVVACTLPDAMSSAESNSAVGACAAGSGSGVDTIVM